MALQRQGEFIQKSSLIINKAVKVLTDLMDQVQSLGMQVVPLLEKGAYQATVKQGAYITFHKDEEEYVCG